MDLIQLRWNKKPYFMPLPDLGGGPRGTVIGIGGMQISNPLGMGAIQGNAA
jgi:hypothetical protein